MFTLKIETDNAAFDPDARPEIATLLRRIADALENGTSGAPIFDTNGNRCGRFDLEN